MESIKEAKKLVTDMLNWFMQTPEYQELCNFIKHKPQFWGNTADDTGKITSFGLRVSAIEDSIETIPDAKPFVTVEIGSISNSYVQVIKHPNHDPAYTMYECGEEVKESETVLVCITTMDYTKNEVNQYNVRMHEGYTEEDVLNWLDRCTDYHSATGEFMYSNTPTKMYDAGDIVFYEGDDQEDSDEE